jgi:hypothetical protein
MFSESTWEVSCTWPGAWSLKSITFFVTGRYRTVDDARFVQFAAVFRWSLIAWLIAFFIVELIGVHR